MPIIMAKHAGFCSGVSRAVNQAIKLAKTHKGINSLGELVHNSSVIRRLDSAGVVASNLESISSDQVIIRSHGVSPTVIADLQERGKTIYDLTCPFVSRLHQKVAEYSKDGLPVILVGDGTHPEIVGTIGWCKGETYIVDSIADAAALPQIPKALAVAQTTFRKDLWNAICEVLKQKVADLSIMDTICTATVQRQNAAIELARRADAMIVVGGRNSANTQKLYKTCKELCSRTILVERAEEIPQGFADINSDMIGITAGASTPEWSLKEVVTRMTDIEKMEQVTQEAEEVTSVENTAEAVVEQTAAEHVADSANADFMAQVDATMVKIHPGQVIKGTVVQITEDGVCVDIGYKTEGRISREDLAEQEVKLGDEIEAEVLKSKDSDGYVSLSQRNIINRKVWEELVAKYENNETVEAVAKDVVKGGVIARINGVRAFIPASQIALRYIDNLEQFKGQTLKLHIIELDQQKKRIVASRKAVLLEEEKAKKAEAWNKLEVGKVVEGIVRRLTNFGAFVDLDGIDGLIHVTDLSWGRVKHPSDVVKPDQKVLVKILSLDEENQRIQLGLKQTSEHPWENIEEKFPVGSVVEGKVVRITAFGAFVELADGLDGLVHISQCALNRINKVEDAVHVGQDVRVKVLSINPEDRRISLSIREVLADEALDTDLEDLDMPSAEVEVSEVTEE